MTSRAGTRDSPYWAQLLMERGICASESLPRFVVNVNRSFPSAATLTNPTNQTAATPEH